MLVLGDSSFIASIIRSEIKLSAGMYASMRQNNWKSFCLSQRENLISIIWCIKTSPFDDEHRLLKSLMAFLEAEQIRFKLIYLSTFAVYKIRKLVSAPRVIGPNSKYGKTKLVCEIEISKRLRDGHFFGGAVVLRLSSFFDEGCEKGIYRYVKFIEKFFGPPSDCFVLESYAADDLLNSIHKVLRQDQSCQFSAHDVCVQRDWPNSVFSTRKSWLGSIFWSILVPLLWRYSWLIPPRLRKLLSLVQSR